MNASKATVRTWKGLSAGRVANLTATEKAEILNGGAVWMTGCPAPHPVRRIVHRYDRFYARITVFRSDDVPLERRFHSVTRMNVKR